MGVTGIEEVPIVQDGYKPQVDYQSWRVATLRFCDDLKPENVKTMQKHNESDEVFVLLQGEFTLYSCGAGEHPADVNALKLEKNVIYNVKRGTWHNHSMSEDGVVLIVENQDTCDDNSPIEALNEEQIKQLMSFN